jgi:hypothetical protein
VVYLQFDTTTIIAGGALLFVGVIVVWWFLKRSKHKKVDSTLQNLASIVGNEGGTPGYKYAKTGEPQLLMELKPLTKCTSLIVQYGHYDGKLGEDKGSLNVAAYHVNQELNTIEHGDNADGVVRDSGFQQTIGTIPNLLFFEVRQEGVKTLIWGEMRGTSFDGAKAIYATIKKVADLL